MAKERVFSRLVKSGDHYEYYTYSEGVYVGADEIVWFYNPDTGRYVPVEKELLALDPNKIPTKKGDAYERFDFQRMSVADRDRHQQRNINRSRMQVRRLVNANCYQYGSCRPLFLTFTFAREIASIHVANSKWNDFTVRLTRYLKKYYNQEKFSLKYVCVIEFHKQKSKGVHYHAIFFNMPFVAVSDHFYKKNSRVRQSGERTLSEIWGLGGIDVSAFDVVSANKRNDISDIDNIGAYVSKYMTKMALDDPRYDGSNRYQCSKGLIKPEVIYDPVEIEKIISTLPPPSYVSDKYQNEWCGEVQVKHFKPPKKIS